MLKQPGPSVKVASTCGTETARNELSHVQDDLMHISSVDAKPHFCVERAITFGARELEIRINTSLRLVLVQWVARITLPRVKVFAKDGVVL